MAINDSNPLMETLVRHQFYSSVDWESCVGMDLEFLESEFRAIIQTIANSSAIDLSDESKQTLQDRMILEVCVEERIDGLVFAKYRHLMNPVLPFSKRMSNCLTNFVLRVTGEKKRIQQECEQFRVRGKVTSC